MKTIKYMGMALIMAALASCSSDDDLERTGRTTLLLCA